jgi:uncharacterized membrane protein YfcA
MENNTQTTTEEQLQEEISSEVDNPEALQTVTGGANPIVIAGAIGGGVIGAGAGAGIGYGLSSRSESKTTKAISTSAGAALGATLAGASSYIHLKGIGQVAQTILN